MFMNAYSDFLRLIDIYLIKGIFISVLVVIGFRWTLKNKINTEHAPTIIKWIMIVYSTGRLIELLLLYSWGGLENYSTMINRSSGPYWWLYLFLLMTHSVLPLILLFKKAERNIYIVFFVALIMNIGWLFESFVIHVTSLSAEYVDKNNNSYLPFNSETEFLLRGLYLGILSIFAGVLIKKYRN